MPCKIYPGCVEMEKSSGIMGFQLSQARNSTILYSPPWLRRGWGWLVSP